MEEFDSIPEVIYWISNVGVIALAILFAFVVKNRKIKFVLVALMLSYHLFAVPLIYLGCEVGLYDEVFCRESWWLPVFIPPILFLTGIVTLLAMRLRNRMTSEV